MLLVNPAIRGFFLSVFIAFGCAACSPAPAPPLAAPLPGLSLSGEAALKLNADYALRFPRRHSGTPNNRAAVDYFVDRLSKAGLSCASDTWTIINYSAPVTLQNGVCRLPGKDSREILIAAHHDQSPATIYGADNDASGMAILILLAEIFAKEPIPSYSLVFLSADAEEYGMLGSKRYVESSLRESGPGQIVAGISLDNMGKRWSAGMGYEAIGQFGGYAPAWLISLYQQSARAYPGLWIPERHPPIFQVLEQAVPVSFMDGGPMVAAGIPALGLATTYPPEYLEDVWQSYHSPNDRIEFQDAAVLHQSGGIAEALLRQLLARNEFPRETGPYLQLSDQAVLSGLPLHAILMGLPLLFAWAARRARKEQPPAPLRPALAAYLALALPLFISIALLRLFVVLGLMDTYHLYPATAKDPALFHPRWPAVGLFVLALALLFPASRRLFARFFQPPSFPERQTIAYSALAIAALYLLFRNPFSLVFLLPASAWLLIQRRAGPACIFNGLAFATGGLTVYALLYFFGFLILRNGLAVLWYIQMMFSIGMIGWASSAVIVASIAAGLSLVIPPPRRSV